MLVIVALLAALGFSWETVQANNGLGWDGVAYAELARNPGPVNTYYASRILPSLIVSLFIPGDASNTLVITAFRFLNLACVLASLLLWIRASDHLKLRNGRWIGFLGLFLSFQAAKQFYYYPVLTDAFAMLSAMAMLVCHLEGRRILLFFLTVLASFAWPTASLVGAALLCFPAGTAEPRQVRGLLPVAVILVTAVLAVAILHVTGSPGRSFVTALPSYAIVAVAAWTLLYRPQRFLLGLVALVLPWLLIRLIASDIPGGGTPRLLVDYVLFPQAGKFLLPFVSFAVYFGPIFVLACILWPRVSTVARQAALAPALLVSLPFILTTEPRHFTFAWPFLVACVAKALDHWPRRSLILLGAWSVFWSQFWLPINYEPWLPGTEDLQQFPKQLWYMHFGFWMSWTAYFAQGALVLLTALTLGGRRFYHRKSDDDRLGQGFGGHVADAN